MGCGAPAAPPFGLDPPGTVPDLFAPGIVSTEGEHEFGLSMSPDGAEVVWAVADDHHHLRLRRFEDGAWQPEQILFPGLDKTVFDPFHARDGEHLFFLARDHGPLSANNSDLWVADRTDRGWGNPRPLGRPPSSEAKEFFVSEAANGALYFASNRGSEERNFDLFRAVPRDAGYAEPERLPGDLNTRWYEGDVFIAPDESYLIVATARPEGRGQSDLYLSVRRSDGTWTAAEPLGGDVNTPGNDFCPHVSPDGRYFAFSRDGDIYWMSAEPVIQQVLRHQLDETHAATAE